MEIEKEKFLEFTTEEEDNTLSQRSNNAFGRSATNVNDKSKLTESKKKFDHLKLFEKKMS